MNRPGVLIIIGAYHPEGSGVSHQCRELVRAMKERVNFTILTTSTDPHLSQVEQIDGVPVHRVQVNPRRLGSKLRATWLLSWRFLQLGWKLPIVHLYGFSQKSMLFIVLSKLFRKKMILTTASAGLDDALSIRSKGRLAFWFYSRMDLVSGVSPHIQESYVLSGLPEEKFRLVPNGVDGKRFRPPEASEKENLRRELRLPLSIPLVLFVGFFSKEKHPDVLFEAWAGLQGNGFAPTGLLLIGVTQSHYHEVDPEISERIRREAHRRGLKDRLFFVEVTHEIEKYFRAADLFILPSSREGLPCVLLEAMASGLPCIASALPGVTEWVIEPPQNGLLVPCRDPIALREKLRYVLDDLARARQMGQAARESVLQRYSIGQAANLTLEAYRQLQGAS